MARWLNAGCQSLSADFQKMNQPCYSYTIAGTLIFDESVSFTSSGIKGLDLRKCHIFGLRMSPSLNFETPSSARNAS